MERSTTSLLFTAGVVHSLLDVSQFGIVGGQFGSTDDVVQEFLGHQGVESLCAQQLRDVLAGQRQLCSLLFPSWEKIPGAARWGCAQA